MCLYFVGICLETNQQYPCYSSMNPCYDLKWSCRDLWRMWMCYNFICSLTVTADQTIHRATCPWENGYVPWFPYSELPNVHVQMSHLSQRHSPCVFRESTSEPIRRQKVYFALLSFSSADLARSSKRCPIVLDFVWAILQATLMNQTQAKMKNWQ